jgi:hypothetical protein
MIGLIGLLFMSFSPWFYLLSPDQSGKTAAITVACVGILLIVANVIV